MTITTTKDVKITHKVGNVYNVVSEGVDHFVQNGTPTPFDVIICENDIKVSLKRIINYSKGMSLSTLTVLTIPTYVGNVKIGELTLEAR